MEAEELKEKWMMGLREELRRLEYIGNIDGMYKSVIELNKFKINKIRKIRILDM